MRAYVTKRPNGLFCISSLPPAIARVGKTKVLDAYVVPGDGFGQHRVPPSAMDYMFGELDWSELEPTRAEFSPRGNPAFLSTRTHVWGEQCMVTELEPVEIKGDLWPRPGDRLYCDVFCPWFARSLWGVVPEVGQCTAVQISGRTL